MRVAAAVPRQQHEELQARCDSYASANLTMDANLQVLRSNYERLKGECARLEGELSAARESNQLLGAKVNTKYQEQNRELVRLHGLLEKHGIDPEG